LSIALPSGYMLGRLAYTCEVLLFIHPENFWFAAFLRFGKWGKIGHNRLVWMISIL